VNAAAAQIAAPGATDLPAPGRGAALLVWPLALIGLAVVLALATYSGLEATVLGAIVAAAVLTIVVAKPEIGIFLLMTNYLIASYPTPLRGQGLLTINNLLGIILAVLLVAHLAQKQDLWFLRIRQVQIYLAIGVVLIIGSIASSYYFPDLRVTRGRFRFLDQTGAMSQDFATRLAFLVFVLNFLTRKADLKRAVTIMLLCLVMVVPSALAGYASGEAIGGYRAAASFSLGTNPNRLAFLCLVQIAFWWYFMRAHPSTARLALGTATIGSLILTVLLTASRSGILGLGLTFYLLTRTRAGVRGGRIQVIAVALVAIGAMMTLLPAEHMERFQNMNPFATGTKDVGAHSTERRVETVEVGWEMFGDYPLFGVGIGNFREVAKQVYQDPFFRPPHNSYVWALSEGGIFCLGLYLLLFWRTWRDIKWLQASPAVPQDLRWIAAALAPSFILFLFYSAFADIWLSPITYILIAIVIVFRRYVSCRRAVVV
jgi:O-antigen ligase